MDLFRHWRFRAQDSCPWRSDRCESTGESNTFLTVTGESLFVAGESNIVIGGLSLPDAGHLSMDKSFEHGIAGDGTDP